MGLDLVEPAWSAEDLEEAKRYTMALRWLIEEGATLSLGAIQRVSMTEHDVQATGPDLLAAIEHCYEQVEGGRSGLYKVRGVSQ